MAAGANNIKGINSNFDKKDSYNPEVLIETKGGNITRSNHTLNSALAILENSEYFSDVLGVNPNIIALSVFAHSKSNSGVKNLTLTNNWELAIDVLNESYDLYNETYHPGENKKSFVESVSLQNFFYC